MLLARLKSHIPLLKTVWRLALPVLLTNLLQSFVNVIDVFMVGRLGSLATAAIGMASVIRILVLVMVLSVTSGAMALVSQAKGAGDHDRMSIVARQAISSGILLSFVLMAIGLFSAEPLLQFANSSDDTVAVQLGAEYLQIFFFGISFLILNFVINRLMQGAGDTITPLYLTAFVNLLNIAFNYIFMFGLGPIPAFGLRGAAIGTIAARAIGVVIGLSIIYSGRNVIKIGAGSYWPDRQMFTDIFSIGVPSGIQGIFRNGSRLLVVKIISATEVGVFGISALAIGTSIESLAFMPILGINVAATSLIGQSLGRWQTKEAQQRGNMAIALGLFLMILFTIPLVVFAPILIRWFAPDANPTVLATGTLYMRTNTLALPMTAIAMVANGAMRGAGDSTPGMISTLATRGGLSIILAYVFGILLDYGSIAVWIALLVGLLLDGVFMGTRWRTNRWIGVALRKSEVYRQHLQHLPDKIQQQYLSEIRTPLMAESKTFERVTKQGVTYQMFDRDVVVTFDSADYKTTTLAH
ncbi:MAG: MATE family efflux transporter [Candidatus Promineifilaceae bacterium]